jgi:hypothetical protein
MRILLLLALLLLPLPGWAARQFNGTSDYLNSASTLTYGSATKVAVSFWLYWDSFTNGGDVVIESAQIGVESGVGTWTLRPDNESGGFLLQSHNGAGSPDNGTITRPSGAAWHHYVINFDVGQTGHHTVSAFVDGSSATITPSTTQGTTTTFTNKTLYLMSRAGSSRFGAGRLADVAIYTGISLSESDASSLNSGTLPTSVQSGNLIYYWKLCGTASPETPTTGAVNLTVTGATQVDHPAAISASCGAQTFFGRRLQQQ